MVRRIFIPMTLLLSLSSCMAFGTNDTSHPLSSFASPLPEYHVVYIPVSLRNYSCPDDRYIIWLGDIAEARQAGLEYYNVAARFGECEECLYQWVFPGHSVSAVANWAGQHPGHYYIIGDEPDQHDISPEEYILWYEPYRVAILAIDPTARVSLAGIAQPNSRPCQWGHGLEYLDVLHQIGFETDELRVHAFAEPGNLIAWKSYILSWIVWRNIYMPGVQITLGTFGYPGTAEADPVAMADLQAALQWLETTEIEAWFYWAWNQTGSFNNLWNDNNGLTVAGEIFLEEARR